MKKLVITAVILMCAIVSVNAQTGFFNSKQVLEKIPQYNSAQQQLEKIKSGYESEIKGEMDKIEKMFNQYQAQKGRMNESDRRTREKQIIERERGVKELRESRFGQEGDLAKKSKELMDPIMQKMQTALESVSKEYGMVLVLDLATTPGIGYYDKTKDITSVIIKKLGLK